MSKLVTTLALAVLLLGAALYAFGDIIIPAANDAGRSTAVNIRAAF